MWLLLTGDYFNKLILLVGSVCLFLSAPVYAQDSIPLAPLLDSDGANNQNSLMNLLKNDLLRRYTKTTPNEEGSQNRPRRPRPELGKGQYSDTPIDLSKFIGPDGDSDETLKRLREMGKIPDPDDIPMPKDATGTIKDVWSDVAPENRLDYAKELFKRRKYEQTQKELEAILAHTIDKDERFDALMIREKCLFHRRFYDVVQDDYFRLKSYYPKKSKEIAELRKYLEDKSGLTSLQEKVLKNPTDPANQRSLLNLFEKLDWLDFAEDFFLLTIHDISAPTVKSLSEVYYRKKDHEMLVNLARASQKLHPGEADFYYNEGVGLYAMGDPTSLESAEIAFQKALAKASTTRMRNNIEWYLNRLNPKKQ